MDISLDDVIHFDVITSRPTTGAAIDADSAPTWAIYEEATDTAVASGTFTKRTSLDGNYRGTATLSTANGFEVGKWYNVVATGIVGAVTGKAVVMRFAVVAAPGTAGGVSIVGSEMALTDAAVAEVQSGLATSSALSAAQSDITAIRVIVTAIQTVLSGITSLGNWLRVMSRKDAGTDGMVTAQSEINTGGTATFSRTTDSLEGNADASTGTVTSFSADALAQLRAQGITVNSTTPSPTKIDVHIGADHNADGGTAWSWTNLTGIEWIEMAESEWTIEIHDGEDADGAAVVAMGTVEVIESDFDTGQRIQGAMTAEETAKLRSSPKAAAFFVYQDGLSIGKQLRAWGAARKIG